MENMTEQECRFLAAYRSADDAKRKAVDVILFNDRGSDKKPSKEKKRPFLVRQDLTGV